METLLDHLTNALPIMSELAFAAVKPRPLVREFQPLARNLVQIGASLFAAKEALKLGLAGAGLFLTILGGFLAAARHSKHDIATVEIKVGESKVAWRGVAALGCIVAGILILLLAFSSHQYT